MKKSIFILILAFLSFAGYAHQSFTLRFADHYDIAQNTADNNKAISQDEPVGDLFVLGLEKVDTAFLSQVYYGKKGFGLKLGRSSSDRTGKLAIKLKESVRPVKIVFEAAAWQSAGENPKYDTYLKFNDTEYTLPASPELRFYEWEGTGEELDSLVFTTQDKSLKGRAYIHQITVIVLDNETEPYLFGFPEKVEIGRVYEKMTGTAQFTVIGGNLESEVELMLNNQSEVFELTPENISLNEENKISEKITVTYSPLAPFEEHNIIHISSGNISTDIELTASCEPEPAGYVFEQVTDLQDLQDGDKILLAQKGSNRVNGWLRSDKKGFDYIDIVRYDRISEQVCQLTLKQTDDAWQLLNAHGEALAVKGRMSDQVLAWENDLPNKWNISIEDEQITIINTVDTCGTIYYSTSGEPRFMAYSSAPNAQKQLPTVWKKVPKHFDINIVAEEGGETLGSGNYELCDTIEIRAMPVSEKYLFDHWTYNFTENPRQIVVGSDSTITAYFRIATFDVSLSCNEEQGTVYGSGTYEYGEQVQIVAEPKEHYHFVEWSDGNTEADRQITITENTELSATFALDTHTVSIVLDPQEGGVATGAGEYEFGEEVKVSVTANENYIFTGWSNGETETELTLVIGDEDIELTAHFDYVEPAALNDINKNINIVKTQDCILVSCDKSTSIRIYNALGQCIYSTIAEKQTFKLQKGIYIIEVGNEKSKVEM